jgi:predicted membrane channel-forming protein YqfA (hemolysin III family)
MHPLTFFASLGLWPILQLIACTAIAVSLLTYRRGRSRHAPLYAWLAWFIAIGCAGTIVKILCGLIPPPGAVTALLSVAYAVLIVAHRGDIAHATRWQANLCRWLWRRFSP